MNFPMFNLRMSIKRESGNVEKAAELKPLLSYNLVRSV